MAQFLSFVPVANRIGFLHTDILQVWACTIVTKQEKSFRLYLTHKCFQSLSIQRRMRLGCKEFIFLKGIKRTTLDTDQVYSFNGPIVHLSHPVE
jgi:hypothetical protein